MMKGSEGRSQVESGEVSDEIGVRRTVLYGTVRCGLQHSLLEEILMFSDRFGDEGRG